MPEQAWYLYLLECDNGYLYCGITTDVRRRFEQHRSGRGARFTRINRPQRILGAARFDDRSSVSVAEVMLKRQTRTEKLRWSEQYRWSEEIC